MKKFLNILGAISLSAIMTSSTVSCFWFIRRKYPIPKMENVIGKRELGTFYYPKKIEEKRRLPSEAEIWNRIYRLHKYMAAQEWIKDPVTGEPLWPEKESKRSFFTRRYGQKVVRENIKVTNITENSALIIAGDKKFNGGYFSGSVEVKYDIKQATEPMQISDIIENNLVYRNVKCCYCRAEENVDYKTAATRFINYMYKKLEDLYTVEVLTPSLSKFAQDSNNNDILKNVNIIAKEGLTNIVGKVNLQMEFIV
ncbi:hypothetical protein [Mesoplasma seiffertii]|uniref:hypothetical protein n=1 Tax=Mesoplasma seiffertii TaxID=28224 RepID=UPI00047E29F0|nr:hypothetical protein [Mesoplasma seiffertii]